MKENQRVAPAVPQLFIASLGKDASDSAFILMSKLQAAGIRVEMDYQAKSLKAQMRRANKLNSAFTLILGEEEIATGRAQLKNMADSSQVEVTLDSLVDTLSEKLA